MAANKGGVVAEMLILGKEESIQGTWSLLSRTAGIDLLYVLPSGERKSIVAAQGMMIDQPKSSVLAGDIIIIFWVYFFSRTTRLGDFE